MRHRIQKLSEWRAINWALRSEEIEEMEMGEDKARRGILKLVGGDLRRRQKVGNLREIIKRKEEERGRTRKNALKQ